MIIKNLTDHNMLKLEFTCFLLCNDNNHGRWESFFPMNDISTLGVASFDLYHRVHLSWVHCYHFFILFFLDDNKNKNIEGIFDYKICSLTRVKKEIFKFIKCNMIDIYITIIASVFKLHTSWDYYLSRNIYFQARIKKYP